MPNSPTPPAEGITNLVLTRRGGQAVTITPPDGPPIDVIVIGTAASFTRLAFQAPRNVEIVRRELLTT